MSGWMSRFTSGTQSAPPTALGTPTTALTPAYAWPIQRPQKPRDPNTPDHRLQLNRKCIYERRLPGESYITVHCERLQSGFYDSPGIHEDSIENVRFVALNFVFHPSHTINRFKSARISVALHNQDAPQPPNPFDVGSRVQTPDPEKQATNGRRRSSSRGPGLRARSRSRTRPPKPYPHEDAKISDGPKFLRHAPHLLYGAISPETLQWNFNLAGSLGVSQTPVSASLQPSGGVKSSYKIFEMMKIQGSVRSLRSWYGRDYDVEDGEIVWTLEENKLQKSGLPREFTFVMMVHKGAAENNVAFDVEIEPQVGSFVGGHFPKWYVNFLQYQPLHKELLDLDKELGQRFDPCTPGRGYNFANLESTFDDFVSMPGTTYSSSDRPPELGAGPAPADPQQAGAAAQGASAAAGGGGQGKATQGQPNGGKGGGQGQPPAKAGSGSAPSAAPATTNDINVRVFIERGESQTPSPNQTRTSQREPNRSHSVRKQRSREGLRQFGEQQDTPTRDITESPEQIQPRRRRNSASGAVNSAISQAQALVNNTRSPPPGHRRSSSTAPESLTATSRSPPIHYSPKPQRPISFSKLSSTRPEDDLHVTRTHSPARSPQPSFQRPLSRSPHTLPHLHTPATNATKPRSPLANEYEDSFLKPMRPTSQLNRFPSADPKTWVTAADDHEPLYSVITPNKEQDPLDHRPYPKQSRQNHYQQPTSSGPEMTMTHTAPIHRDFAELSRMRSSTPKDFAAVQDLQHLMHSPPRQKAAAISPPRIPQQPRSPRRDEDITPRQGMRGTAPAPPPRPVATTSRPTAAASTAPRPAPAPQAMFPSQLPGKITEESPAASATTNMLSSRETRERERATRALEGASTQTMQPSHGYQMPPQPPSQPQPQQHQSRRRAPLGSSENYDQGQGVRDSGYHSAQGATPPEGWAKDANFQVSPISDDYTRPPVPEAPPVEAPMPPKALVAPRKRNSVRSSYPSWRANGTIG